VGLEEEGGGAGVAFGVGVIAGVEGEDEGEVKR